MFERSAVAYALAGGLPLSLTRRLKRKTQRKSANRLPHSATIVAIDIVPSRLEMAV
jgi:hypothetical protein